MTHDRRLEYRIQADLLIYNFEVTSENTQAAKGIIRELSASGCRIESSLDLAVGQKIQMGFELTPGHKVTNVWGRVVRRLSYRTRKVVAIEFIDLSEQDQYLIREFVVWKEAQAQNA